jgi:elongation factor Ts
MTEISASQVKELRDMTGAPMMDAKRALVETEGDLEKAAQLLREKGLSAAAKRATRQVTEGRVIARIENTHGAIVAVGSETEPVSKNTSSLGFAEKVIDAVEKEGPDAISELETERADLVARIGENIEVVGASRFEAHDNEVLASYVHPPAQKIGVLVRAQGSSDLARLVAMHIAFANPRFVTRDEVPEDEIAAERDILEKLPDLEGKPDDVKAKMIEGRLAKGFFADSVLFVTSPGSTTQTQTVGQALAEHGAEVRDSCARPSPGGAQVESEARRPTRARQPSSASCLPRRRRPGSQGEPWDRPRASRGDRPP